MGVGVTFCCGQESRRLQISGGREEDDRQAKTIEGLTGNMKQAVETESPNVVLITVDVLRHDHLGCYGYQRSTSPNIDHLAAGGVRFLEAISHGGSTPQSFPSILASALPPLRRSWGRRLLRPHLMLAQLLKDAGYQTAAFHSNPWLSRYYGYDQGFDTFDDTLSGISPRRLRLGVRERLSPDTLGGTILRKVGKVLKPVLQQVAGRAIVTASETTAKAASWVKANQCKFFLWLHYMDVHHPYLPASKYVRYFRGQPMSRQKMYALSGKMMSEPARLSPREIETIIGLYDAEVRYVDASIGVLLDELRNYSSNTLTIVTADHGDEFGEHGKFGHQSLYDGILHVPLIINGPTVKGGTLVKQQVGLMDLAPTIAELVGINSAPNFRGKSLRPLIEGKEGAATGTISTFFGPPSAARRSIAYRISGWKYIRTETLDGADTALGEEIYDLRNDPGETRNLHGQGDENANEFELEAKRRIAQFKQLTADEATGYEKRRIRAKLSKLDKL